MGCGVGENVSVGVSVCKKIGDSASDSRACVVECGRECVCGCGRVAVCM